MNGLKQDIQPNQSSPFKNTVYPFRKVDGQEGRYAEHWMKEKGQRKCDQIDRWRVTKVAGKE